MLNPKQVAANRTARLVREARTPAYTSETKVEKAPERDHLEMLEVQDSGGRYWSGPFTSKQLPHVIEDYLKMGYSISDIDCSAKCWCSE